MPRVYWPAHRRNVDKVAAAVTATTYPGAALDNEIAMHRAALDGERAMHRAALDGKVPMYRAALDGEIAMHQAALDGEIALHRAALDDSFAIPGSSATTRQPDCPSASDCDL